jgi:hypothetical protein
MYDIRVGSPYDMPIAMHFFIHNDQFTHTAAGTLGS